MSEDWRVPVRFTPKNGSGNVSRQSSGSSPPRTSGASKTRTAPGPLRASPPALLPSEYEQASFSEALARGALNSSSPAVLVGSEMLDDDLADLMTIPKLPFEIVDNATAVSPPVAKARLPPPPSSSPIPPPSAPLSPSRMGPSSTPNTTSTNTTTTTTTTIPTTTTTTSSTSPTKTSQPTKDHKLAKQQAESPRSPVLNVSRIDKSMVNRDVDGKGVVKWCSWCFQYAPQKKLEDRWMGRNAHECGHCLNETCVCMMCSEGACRSYGTSADKLCFKCDGTYSKAKVTSAMKLEGRCSWCLQKSSHTLHKAALVMGRDVYLCDSCGKRTVPCRGCQVALARSSDEIDEEQCVKCNHSIEDWDSSPRMSSPRGYSRQKQNNNNRPDDSSSEDTSGSSPPLLDVALLSTGDDDSIDGWCSWCIEDTRHELVARSLLTRNTYRCTDCMHRTLCCLQCEDGMSRSGVGWDDKVCVSCTLRGSMDSKSLNSKATQPWDWLHLKEKKDAVFDPERYTHARVMTLLSLGSPFKDQAIAEGMVRPFLILVSMRPSKRNRVSNELGWSCIPSPLFGDAHAESWEIINASALGLQARLNSTVEKLNPLSRSVCWIECLERVCRVFGKLDEDSNALAHLDSDQCLVESRKPYSRFVQRQEQVLMIRLGRLYYKYLLTNHLKPPQGEKATAIMNKIKDATGMSDTYGLTWAASIFFKPKTGVPRFNDAVDVFLTGRDEARPVLVVLEIIKQMLRLFVGFSVFVDDFCEGNK